MPTPSSASAFSSMSINHRKSFGNIYIYDTRIGSTIISQLHKLIDWRSRMQSFMFHSIKFYLQFDFFFFFRVILTYMLCQREKLSVFMCSENHDAKHHCCSSSSLRFWMEWIVLKWYGKLYYGLINLKKLKAAVSIIEINRVMTSKGSYKTYSKKFLDSKIFEEFPRTNERIIWSYKHVQLFVFSFVNENRSEWSFEILFALHYVCVCAVRKSETSELLLVGNV